MSTSMNECAEHTCEYCDETIPFATDVAIEIGYFNVYNVYVHDYCVEEWYRIKD